MAGYVYGFSTLFLSIYYVGATGPVAPTTLATNSLGSIIGQFRSVVTKKIRKTGSTNFKWQRNFHERIIRNEKELQHIRQYIINNPRKWELDRENPENWNNS